MAAACSFKDFDLAVDAQHLGHFCFELCVAVFKVIAHLMRLHLLGREDLAQRALREFGEAVVTLLWSMIAGVASQQPGGNADSHGG